MATRKVLVEKMLTSKLINAKRELAYLQIKNATERLSELRTVCKHENTFEGNYTYGDVSRSFPAKICSDCGDCIERI